KTSVANKVGPRSMNSSDTSLAARCAPRWLVAAMLPLLLSTLLAGGCSLSNLPVAGTKPASPSAQASPTPGLPSDGSEAKVTPRATSPAQGAQATQAPSGPSGTAPQGATWQVPAEQQAVVQVIERVGPAVVTVVNRLDSSQGFSGEARGSGVIVDQDGRIITNNHVVERASGLTVLYSKGP